MTKPVTMSRTDRRSIEHPVRPRRLPRTAAFYLQASIVVFFLAGSSAPTPLYARYQAEWGFSPITTTVVFGVYAVAVLLALLVVGSLSDHVGRRPVLLAAIAVQAVAMLIFATAGGVPELLLGRVVQGLATGAAAGAVGAGMLDLDKERGTVANAVAPMMGTALGAIGAGLLVQFLPAPEQLVYLVLLVVFLLQGVGVAFMRETTTAQAGALASLRPRIALPAAVRRPFLVAMPAIVAVWALAGLYGSIGPAVVRLLVGTNSPVLSGLAFFALAAAGAATVLLLRRVPPRSMMLLGAVALFVGVGSTLLAVQMSSTAAFLAGTVLAGVGFGAGFQGAVRTVVPLAEPHERAGVLSLVYVVSYLALGVPAVAGGFLVVLGGGVAVTAREYGLGVMLLAAVTVAGLVVRRRPAGSRSAVPDDALIAVRCPGTGRPAEA